MKNIVILFVLLILTSCSLNKYTANLNNNTKTRMNKNTLMEISLKQEMNNSVVDGFGYNPKMYFIR